MISPWIGIFTLVLGAGEAFAQVLHDPMRPPSYAIPSSGGGAEVSQAGPLLQSTLISNGRRIAMIDGRPMKVGDRIGDARIVIIDPASVTLREGKITRVLELFQGFKVTHTNPPASSAQRSAKAQKSP